MMFFSITRALVSVAGVWGGTARALKVFAVGDNLDSWSVYDKIGRECMRYKKAGILTFSSNSYQLVVPLIKCNFAIKISLWQSSSFSSSSSSCRFLNSKNLLWERTNPSLAWLMPQQGFWPDDEVPLMIMMIFMMYFMMNMTFFMLTTVWWILS